jgi:hypothetical protein
VSGGEVQRATHVRRALILSVIVEDPALPLPDVARRCGITPHGLSSELYRMGMSFERARALATRSQFRICPRCEGTGRLPRRRRA